MTNLPRRLMAKTIFILLAAVTLAVGATFLPDKPYQRFQLLDNGIYDRTRWVYERLHFDPRPVDVAIVGDSRTALGLNTTEIERQLSAEGKPAHVVNMSLVGGGRNGQWLFVQELLKTKTPKVIVLAINEQPHPWGHPGFRYTAPASEIWREAFQGLHNTKTDLVYLPFRQLKLFAASLAPGAFGLQDHFDRTKYVEALPDAPPRHVNEAGEVVDMSLTVPRQVLQQEAQANAREFSRHSRLPAMVRAVTDADNQVYTDLIARAAARRGVKLVFVYQPGFQRSGPILNRSYYEALGIVQDDTDLNDRDELFHDWGHVNSAGATIVSDRLAAVLRPLLP